MSNSNKSWNNYLKAEVALRNYKNIGYSESQGKALVAGGIYPLLLREVEDIPMLYVGTHINEISPFSKFELISPLTNASDYCLIDVYYQRLFTPIKIGQTALYGEIGVDMIDPIEKNGPEKVGDVRVNFKSIPTYLVQSRSELDLLVTQVRKSRPDERVLLYRGQGRLHLLERSTIVNQMLYGTDKIIEPSLLTYAARHSFDYETIASSLDADLQSLFNEGLNIHDHVKGYFDEFDKIIKDREYRTFNQRRVGLENGQWPILIMAIAQHYGIPTYGLDVTRNLDVALWFASNKFYCSSEGMVAYYEPRYWDCGGLSNCPAVLIFSALPSNQVDLETIEAICETSSLRIKRQSAHFLFGGWGPHLNICAQDLELVAYLPPTVKPRDDLDYMRLFPSSSEDDLYRMLLRRKKKIVHPVLREIYKRIVEYVPMSSDGASK
jgi:hypothetical protein